MKKRQFGFTMAELVISLGIASLGLLAVAYAMSSVGVQNQISRAKHDFFGLQTKVQQELNSDRLCPLLLKQVMGRPVGDFLEEKADFSLMDHEGQNELVKRGFEFGSIKVENVLVKASPPVKGLTDVRVTILAEKKNGFQFKSAVIDVLMSVNANTEITGCQGLVGVSSQGVCQAAGLKWDPVQLSCSDPDKALCESLNLTWKDPAPGDPNQNGKCLYTKNGQNKCKPGETEVWDGCCPVGWKTKFIFGRLYCAYAYCSDSAGRGVYSYGHRKGAPRVLYNGWTGQDVPGSCFENNGANLKKMPATDCITWMGDNCMWSTCDKGAWAVPGFCGA